MFWITDGVPEVRRVGEGRIAVGADWLGLTARNAYRTVSVETSPLLPGFIVMLLMLLVAAAAWHRESGAART